MATRKNRKGQYKKSTSRRRSKAKTNLTALAVSALVANSVSKNVTGAGLVEFFTSKTGGGGSFTITARELGDYLMGGNAGIYGPSAVNAGIDATPQGVMLRNIKENWMPLTASIVLIPIVAGVATKLLRKPIILPANRMLKSMGLKDVKL